MKQKTLGEVARDTFAWATGPTAADDWAASAAAVVAEHERLKWKPIETMGSDGRVIVGYWCGDEWVQCMGMAYMLSHFHEYTHWQYAPEGPKP